MNHERRLGQILGLCQSTWLKLNHIHGNHDVCQQDLHKSIKQLVQLQDAIDEGNVDEQYIETIIDQSRSTLQRAVSVLRQSKAPPCVLKSISESPSDPSLRYDPLVYNQVGKMKLAPSATENCHDTLSIDAELDGLSSDLSDVSIGHSTNDSHDESDVNFASNITQPLAASASSVISSERTFDHRSLNGKDSIDLQTTLSKAPNSPFHLLGRVKPSQSTPLPSESNGHIDLFKTTSNNQRFATDAIVDHPLRVGKGYGSYVCYCCTVLSNKGSPITVRKRYSDFVDLRNNLLQQYPQMKKSIPKLPPKKVVGKFTPSFVEQRRRDLEYFFKYIVLHPTLGSSTIVRHWIAGVPFSSPLST